MSTSAFLERCRDLVGSDNEAENDADSLIGFFQTFRPDGLALNGLYEDLECGEGLHQRLEKLFVAAGNDRRPQGGRDAYFVIRNPSPLDPDVARQLGTDWLSGLRQVAECLGDASLTALLDPLPSIRVLEGIPPKHPKEEHEKSQLLIGIREESASLVDQIDAGPFAPLLRPAYYFTACDAMLRDYLMWPFYGKATGLDDPLAPYFDLWRHGVKYRIFGETQVDLYLPRQQA